MPVGENEIPNMINNMFNYDNMFYYEALQLILKSWIHMNNHELLWIFGFLAF
jgi:hypothetical protein